MGMEGYCGLKARKGLIKAKIRLGENGALDDVKITGDFFFYPEELLEELEYKLKGLKCLEEAKSAIKEFFKSKNIITPGASIDDFVKVVECAYLNARSKR